MNASDVIPSGGRFAREFAAIAEYWSPRVVAAANGQYLKLAKVMGEFLWHSHPGEDDLFLVCKGRLTLRFRDGSAVTLNPGDFHVVPKGVEHLPIALEETWLVLFEPAATRHAGDVETARSKPIQSQTAHLTNDAAPAGG
jgi:mannose-6-phosphate isomerase-like protein (cupin superfamily)